MILSKDLQEILEGVHYFLAEALQKEALSGRAECLRRGLVLQLEGLAGKYPALRITPTLPGGAGGVGGGLGVRGPGSSTSLPYLPMGQPGSNTPPTATTTTTYSSSSGVNSSGNSSSGSSGDGFVVGRGVGGVTTTTTTTLKERTDDDLEMYEEFDDFTEDESVDSKPVGGGGGKEEEDKEEDGVYTESDEPVSFSSVIASCERHGPLGKRTKGLLRQVKTYLCVASGGCLYLYLKETDDRQRKTIDLSGYVARAATGEDIKDVKKRDAAFELVCPGKKTHTFIARTARDKGEWLAALSRTIPSGKSRPLMSIPPVPTAPMPQIPGMPAKPQQPPQPPQEYKFYHDVVGDGEEVYEEISGEGEEGVGDGFLPPPPPDLLTPPPQPPPAPQPPTTNLPTYDPVEPENPPSSAPPRPPPPTRPPLPQTRPPLPQQNRPPLPTVPDGGVTVPAGGAVAEEDYDDLYCEIEEIIDIVEQGGLLGGGGGAAMPPPQLSTPPQPLKHVTPATTPTKTQVGALSEEVFSKLASFSPTQPLPATPPRLPPKGVAPPESEDSEYKVPAAANMEYQVPPANPVLVEARRNLKEDGRDSTSDCKDGKGVLTGAGGKEGGVTGAGGKEGGAGVITSPLLPKIPPTQGPQAEILPIKPATDSRNSVKERKGTVSSFLGKGGEGGDSSSTPSTFTSPLRPSTSTSVKDMIARLNQNRTTTTTTTTTTTSTPTTATSPTPPDSLALPKQNLRPDKPTLAPRPPHLRDPSPNPPKQEEEEELYSDLAGDEQGAEEEEEELYMELADEEEQEETKGEWYVAKFSFVATLPQALSFSRGDAMLVYDRSGDSGWWRASLGTKKGLVPREYLKPKE